MLIGQHDNLPTILEKGRIELKGQFVLGSNYTFLVTVKYEGRQIPAVYKPQQGEQTLWDFPPASLAGREVCAYLVSQALGFGMVPYTILRDGPYGPGSLQEHIDYDPDYHYFNFTRTDLDRLRPVVLFDLLVNNADRKGSHILVQKGTGKLYLIDHGLCFHAEDKLRTVVWDFAGESIPQDLLSTLSTFQAELSGLASLTAALGCYLTPEELVALQSRAEEILASRQFPYPPEERRAFPFPPL
jgi:Phosphatidylinositol 3- and 4-kinase